MTTWTGRKTMSLDKTLLGIAKSAVDKQHKARDSRNVVSKGLDAATNKSYANEDKKAAAAALRQWENSTWKPKIEVKLKQALKTRAPHLKPGTPAYQKTYEQLFNKNYKDLQSAKAKAQQQVGTLRKPKQTQRQLDNDYRTNESIRNDTVGTQAAAHAARDTASAVGGALATGSSRLLRAPLQLAADVGENDDGGIFDRGAKALEGYEDNIRDNVYESYGDIQQNGSFSQKLALSAVEQVPALAASFGVAGGVAKGVQLLGAGAKTAAATSYGTAAATMYPQAYLDGSDSTKDELEGATAEQLASAERSQDIYKSMFDRNIKAGMSEDEAYKKARDQTISEIAEESGENVGLATLALSMLAPGVGSFSANQVAGGAVSKWGQKVFNTLAVKADSGKVAKYAIPAAVGTSIVGLNVAEEGLQEGFTDYTAQKAAVDVGVKDQIDTAQTKEAVLMGGILGGLMGGGTYVGTRNSKLHQAQDGLKEAQKTYAQAAEQIPALQEQIDLVSPRSEEGQALTAQLEETKAALNTMAAEAESRGIPKSSLARRAPRIEPTNSTANDFDGGIDGATEVDAQSFEDSLNPDGTPAPQATPDTPAMSEQELDAQDAQIAELIAEQQQLDEAIEDGSNDTSLEESLAAAQNWYDKQRGEGQEGLSGVVRRAAATEQDAVFEQQQESIKSTTTSINDYIAGERSKQRQIDVELEQDAIAAKTEREKAEVAQRAQQREIDRAQEDELLATRAELAQPYDNESFDTTVVGADGAPFNLARFWDSNMPAPMKAKSIADAFSGQVEQNVAKSDWASLPDGVQKDLHNWFAERLDGVRQEREGWDGKTTTPEVEQPQVEVPTATGLTMPEQQAAAKDKEEDVVEPSAPIEAEQEADVADTTIQSQEPTQLTDENPTVNIPAPTEAKVEVEQAPTEQPPVEQAPTAKQTYKSKPAARAAIKKQKIDPKSVAIEQVKGGGFEIMPKQAPKPNYAQAQEQAATELGMTLDDAGEYQGTDAEFEAFANRVDEIQGRSLDNSKPAAQPIEQPTENQTVDSELLARNSKKATKKDGSPKYFLSDAKSQQFIIDNNLGETHEVVDRFEGKQERFEILPKQRTSGVPQVSSENEGPVVQDLPATTPEVASTEKDINQVADSKAEQAPIDPQAGEQSAPAKRAAAKRAKAQPKQTNAETDLAEKHGFNKDNKLDHGELSIPNRTKDIDKQVDSYKKDKAKLDADKLEEVKAKNTKKAEAEKERLAPIKEQAQAEYKKHGTAMVKAYKGKLEAQGVNARDFIRDEAKYNPESFLKLSKKFQEEQQAEPKSSTSAIESTNKPNPTGDWQTQVNGNEFRINEDGVTVRKHDRVVHIRGANSIAANKKAKELANQDIRELHYITAKEDANDPFSEGSIWLDGNGDMVRKKGTKKPTGSLLPILKQAETKKPTAKKADKPAKPTKKPTEIEDFGEKITGARKDMESFYQKEMTDEDISRQPLSKIWPKKDIDTIEDTQMAALATTLRGTIPSKPRKGYKLNSWVSKVKSTRGIMQNMLSGDMPANEFISQLTQVKSVADIGYQAQLLAQLDKKQWSRISKVDPQIGYQKRNEAGDYVPFVGFAVTVDKRTHTFNTEQRNISEIVDKVNKLLAGEVKTPTLRFDVYGRGRGDNKSYFISQASDKDKTPLIEFNDLAAARAFKSNNNAELAELWDQHKERVNVKKSDIRSNANRDRIGPDHRSGQDITTEQFMNTFGLRGGQFGIWVKQGAGNKDRQNMLNDAYDAFMDLAGVLNIPPEAIGLGGKLAISFGARGKGKAMAHYEPSQVIINLTKTKGAGSLAHEWFHALDHHFTSFRDSSDRNKTREGTYITYKPEPSMMYTPQKGRGYLISKPALKKRQENSEDPMYADENWAPDPNHPQGVRPQVEEAFADLINALNESPMKDRATTIDKGAPDGYWSRIIERAARSFESYIIHKLDKQGARSDFLANITPENAFPRNMDRYPYLLESEMTPVAEAFDNLFATIDSKASENGSGKVLFSRSGQVKQAIEEVKTNPAKGNTGTTPKQVVSTLQKRFGKEAVAKLIKSGKLRVRTLNDFVNADGQLLIPNDAEGFYYDGKVALIADNLTDSTAVAAMLHEMGGHAGIQNMLAPQTYMGLMDNFDALVKSGNKYAVKAKERAEASTDTETEAREEYIPYLITEYAQATERGGPIGAIKRFVDRVMAGVRTWVRNNTGVQLKLTPNDITQLAERMIKRLADQKNNPMAVAGYSNYGESAATGNQAQLSQAPAPQSEIDTVREQYEGTDKWMKAPNGKKSNLNEQQWLQTRTPAFKEWFGDWESDAANASKVVDSNGEPKIMYHGSPIGETFNVFKGDDNGSIYTSDNREYANNYANDADNLTKGVSADKKLFEVFVKSDNYFDNTNSKHVSKLADAILENNETSDAGNGETALVIDGEKSLYAKDVIEFTLQDGEGYNWRFMKEPWTQKAIKALDFDGFSVFEGGGEVSVAVYNPNQVKSATDNAGTFDSSNNDIRYSRRYSSADQNEDAATKRERASSAVRLGVAATAAANNGTVRILRRHVATPQHVALLNPDFKKFTDNVQARLAYENNEAGKVQVHVPEIWQTRLLVGKRKEAIKKVSTALFDGTMADKVWSDDELASKFKLTPKQIDLYGRMRASINDSLGNMTVDTLSALAKGTKLVNIETINRLKLTDSAPKDHNTAMQKYMIDELERLDKGGLISKAAVTRMQGQLDEAFKVMDSVTGKFDQLVENGYAPLMRFGDYAVEVRNKETGDLDLFELYEGNDVTGPLAQWKAIKDLEKKYDLNEYSISKGTLNPDAFKQFTDKGLNPETVQLFASELGLDSDGAIQAYLKVAISDRSALKRLIHRKKIPGYSEDMPRVVSAFVMSNARHSGRMLYNGEIENSIQKIKDGNLQGEAQNVFKNMEDPQEEYAGVRNTMFHWFMAFSPAFLLLNLTQPFTQTIPKLGAYTSATRAHTDMAHALGIVGKYSGKATWNATKWVAGKDDPNWQGFEDHLPAWVKKEDYLRMSREGHLDPQNVWMIRGLERGKTGIASGAWGGFENLAGWPAEVSEGINRRSTMIAAFKVAKRMGPAKLKQKGFNSDYEFAVSVIQQTQGVYNKGNRSGLARGTGKLGQFGPLVMVFKQFTINYVEQMIRHGRDKEFKSLALMMLWQFGVAGLFGLPFVDDLRDVLEGGLYRVFGKSFNLKDEMENLMGKTAAQNLMYGVPSNNNPIDFYGRSSMGNLLPLTDFARPGEGDWGEVIGASSSFFENFYTASKYMSEGRARDAVVAASPRYVKDAVNGYEIYKTGAYRNHRGDKVMDMSKSDGIIKGLGQFNPSSNAKPGRDRSEAYHMKNQIKHNQERYSLALAEAIYQNDDERYDKLYEEMDAWNERNKEPYLIDIDKVENSADNRVEKKDFSSAERNEKALPNQLEEYLEEKQ